MLNVILDIRKERSRVSKLVIIGAGSKVFVRKLISDFLLMDGIKLDTISLVDIDKDKLGKMTDFIKKIRDQEKSHIKIESTTERKEVLEGADYVVTTVSVGEEVIHEKELLIADKYGVNQNVGDTIGPGGVLKGLRTAPVLLDVSKDMEKYCPDANILNYTNPMAICMLALFYYTKIKSYGLCHSVQGTAKVLAECLDARMEDVSYLCAGINHMSFYLKYEVKGKDTYPRLKEIANDASEVKRLARTIDYGDASKLNDKVRFEMLKHFGYFITESPWHLSEYLPYFRKNPGMIKEYGVGIRWALEKQKRRDALFDDIVELTNSDKKIEIEYSGEYLPLIIEAIEKNRVYKCNINVPNNGHITNLSHYSCVEVPCLVDASGIHPCYVGDLPEQCAALNRTNINVQILAAQAIVEKDPERKKELAKMAIKLDPYTAAVMTLKDIDNMAEELFELQKDYIGMNP